MEHLYEKALESAEYIKVHTTKRPKVAVVLGSGLGNLTADFTDTEELPYKDIPNFPVSTVAGHKGALLAGRLGEKEVYALEGRFHFYEGYSMKEVCYPFYVLKLLGVEQVVLTIVITTGWVSMLVARDHTMDYNGGVAHAFYYGLCSLPGFADEALPKLYEDLSFGYVLSRSYSSSDIRCSVKGWEDEDHRTANLYLGAYDAAVKSARLDYLVDGKSAAQSALRFMEVDDERSAVQWWISGIPDESTAGVYSIYGAEGVEFGLSYGAELQVVFHAELTDGTRLSALLLREKMPSANNSADGESEGPAMPIVLTKD